MGHWDADEAPSLSGEHVWLKLQAPPTHNQAANQVVCSKWLLLSTATSARPISCGIRLGLAKAAALTFPHR